MEEERYSSMYWAGFTTMLAIVLLSLMIVVSGGVTNSTTIDGNNITEVVRL